MTMMTYSGEATKQDRLQGQGAAPEPLNDNVQEDRAGMPHQSLHLTADEVEVMLCFALTSPLHYGPVEDSLCDKLRHHLHGLYSLDSAHADL